MVAATSKLTIQISYFDYQQVLEPSPIVAWNIISANTSFGYDPQHAIRHAGFIYTAHEHTHLQSQVGIGRLQVAPSYMQIYVHS